jgi:hypothetical protein
LRVASLHVALRERAVHILGVGDVVEPNAQWRAFKRELTGRTWDYALRRLFYVAAPDIGHRGFGAWLEVASREHTAGRITPGDIWLGRGGDVHIVWDEVALDLRLRDVFFAGRRQRHELNYARIRDGRILIRKTLVAVDEGEPQPVPRLPRFHVTPDQRLLVFFVVTGTDGTGKAFAENRLLEIGADGRPGATASVPLATPLTHYMTATVRGGSAPSGTLDLLGTAAGAPYTVRYARVRVD